MPRMTLMRGIPASGKSERSKEIMKEQGNTVRVNKDLIRTMLHFDKFTPKNERITAMVAERIVEAAIEHNLNVIVDDTNLNPTTYNSWKALGHRLGAKVHTEDLDTPIGECLVRDACREKTVGAHVIIKMALQYKEFMKGQKVVLCDLDGTLCDVEHRRHFLTDDPDRKDWKSFFEGLPQDTLREDVAEKVMTAMAENKAHLILVSARPEEYREATMNWLAEQGQKYQGKFPSFVTLIMRADNDSREDSIIKKEIYDKYLKDINIVKIFDDRPRVIRMWESLGLPVEDVGNGEEF